MPGIAAAILATATYSNAVFTLLMPQITEFAQRLPLEFPRPLTVGDVRSSEFVDIPGVKGGNSILKDGTCLFFTRGHVKSFCTATSLSSLQQYQDISRFFGPVKMSAEEAIVFAREALQRMGYSLEDLYADLEPHIEIPPRFGVNTVPIYRLTWPRANGEEDSTSVEIEVNAASRRVESLFLLNRSLWKDFPLLPSGPADESRSVQPETIEAKTQFLTAILPKLNDYISRLDLPVRLPLRANDVAHYSLPAAGLMTGGRIHLKTGFSFFAFHKYVSGFSAPDEFFAGDHEVKVRNYFGNWQLNEEQATELVRTAVEKLGFTQKKLRMLSPPRKIIKPIFSLRNSVPRYLLKWGDYKDFIFVEAEVDADSRTLKHLSIYEHDEWLRGQQIIK